MSCLCVSFPQARLHEEQNIVAIVNELSRLYKEIVNIDEEDDDEEDEEEDDDDNGNSNHHDEHE